MHLGAPTIDSTASIKTQGTVPIVSHFSLTFQLFSIFQQQIYIRDTVPFETRRIVTHVNAFVPNKEHPGSANLSI